MRERLQKVLAGAGVASRRRAEEMIARGEVTVNGQVASLGESVDPEVDFIVAAGQPIAVQNRERAYLAFNKPRSIVTSLTSTHRERTVGDLVRVAQRVVPAGRLDKDTSGLLLLTDDGEWANLVTHPRYGIEKEYFALVQGTPTGEELHRLRAGVQLPDGTVTRPARVRRIGDDRESSRLLITVFEGKKRQIRLMAAAVGHPVLLLERVRIGSIRLGSLREGDWRYLDIEEVEAIRETARRATGSGGA